MARRVWLRFAVLMLLGFSGCDQKALIKKFTPEAEDRFARIAIDHMLNSRVDALIAMFPPAIDSPDGRKNAGQLVTIFRQGKPKNIEVIGAYTQIGAGAQAGRTVQLSYQLEMTTGWFAGFVVIANKDGALVLQNIRFNPIPDSLEKINAFTFSNKSVVHFLMFVLVVAIPFFCIATAVVCARSKVRKKWLWMILILVGLVSVRLNWTSGEVSWGLFQFMLFGGSAFKAGAYAPWTIGIAIPVGAIIFWFKRKTLVANYARVIDSSPPLPPAPSP